MRSTVPPPVASGVLLAIVPQVRQAGPSWLYEAFVRALVEKPGGSSLVSYLCGLCKITDLEWNSLG